MSNFPSREKVTYLREKYPKGCRIRLVKFGTPDTDPNPLENGITGTVNWVDDAGQLSVEWDNGRCLSVCEDYGDIIEKI